MRARLISLVLVLWSLGNAQLGWAQNVLLIYDVDNERVTAFADGLTNAGLTIQKSDTSETGYDGNNPAITDFDAVIHLNGETYATEMNVAGQTALVEFVKAGGVYVGFEWNSFELGEGRMQQMQDLILVQRENANNVAITLVPDESAVNHPFVIGLELSETFAGTFNIGSLREFAEYPAQALLRDSLGNIALAYREFQNGHVFNLHFALNYNLSEDQLMESPAMHRLLADLIGRASNPRMMLAGSHTCLIKDGIRCFGANAFGQLGQGDTDVRGDDEAEMGSALKAVELGTEFKAVRVETGAVHSCALSGSGQLKCWGGNEHGQLGLGDTQDRGDQPGEMGEALPAVDLGGARVVDFALGASHTCAVLEGGVIKCWGLNETGQLGLGDALTRGDEPLEMGAELAPVSIGAGKLAVAIDAGVHHTCALLSDHSVKCWGENKLAQLGLGHTQSIGLLPEQMGEALAAVALPANFEPASLSLGDSHSCALSANGQVACWGDNTFGQLAVGSTENVGSLPEDMGENLTAAMLGDHQTTQTIQCGGDSCCAIFLQATMKCWGSNGYGQLGLGDRETRGMSSSTVGEGMPFVQLGTLQQAKQVILSKRHTCVETNEGWKCWGQNRHGELGGGHTLPLGDSNDTIPAQIPFLSL